MQMQVGKKDTLFNHAMKAQDDHMQIWQRASTKLKTAAVGRTEADRSWKQHQAGNQTGTAELSTLFCKIRLTAECKSMDASPLCHLTMKERIRGRRRRSRRRRKIKKKISTAPQRSLLTTAVNHQLSGRVAAVDVQAGMLHVQSAAIVCVNPGRICDGFIGSYSDILCVDTQQIHKAPANELCGNIR